MLTTRIYSAYFRLRAFTNYTYRSRLALSRILASCLLAERPLYAQDFQSTIAGNSLGARDDRGPGRGQKVVEPPNVTLANISCAVAMPFTLLFTRPRAVI